jgi:hypothetical protein
VYYIAQLRPSIINIGQLDERGNEVLVKDGVLKIRDREQRLLAKAKRSRNQLYLLDLKVERPICLATQRMEEPWLWHARHGHFSFNALGKLEKMVWGNVYGAWPKRRLGDKACYGCWALAAPQPDLVWCPPRCIRRRPGVVWRRADAYSHAADAGSQNR